MASATKALFLNFYLILINFKLSLIATGSQWLAYCSTDLEVMLSFSYKDDFSGFTDNLV